MPFLNGMIFSGAATGDWTLSCVRGSVHSVTYVFNDGSIRTLSSDDGSLQEKSSNQGQSQRGGEQSLGWISDRRGIPCVTGVRISNAIDYLSGRVRDDENIKIPFFLKSSQTIYKNQLALMATAGVLSQVVNNMGSFRLVEHDGYGIIYDLRTVRDDVEYSFQVLFVQDTDGIWRIQNF